MKNNNELNYFIPWDEWAEYIKHVQERADGSSDGLYEAMDIDLGNGCRECSNWNFDLTKKWTLEDLFGGVTEPTAEELVEALNGVKEKMFPKKTELTAREWEEVYKMLNKKWKNE